MNRGHADLTVLMTVSQYVKLEAAAEGNSRSPESEASFLLSDWVLATRGRAMAGAARDGKGPARGERRAEQAAPGEEA